jgi:hypothetical protein
VTVFWLWYSLQCGSGSDHNTFTGDSYGRKGAAKQFIPYLTKWLDSSFAGGFICGIYTANTIEHAIFNTGLISYADCRQLRMHWFLKLVVNASTLTHSVSTTVFQCVLRNLLIGFSPMLPSWRTTTSQIWVQRISLRQFLRLFRSRSSLHHPHSPSPKF